MKSVKLARKHPFFASLFMLIFTFTLLVFFQNTLADGPYLSQSTGVSITNASASLSGGVSKPWTHNQSYSGHGTVSAYVANTGTSKSRDLWTSVKRRGIWPFRWWDHDPEYFSAHAFKANVKSGDNVSASAYGNLGSARASGSSSLTVP